MKYFNLVLFVFLIVGCAHTSTSSEPVNIVGVWEGELNTPMGGPPIRLEFIFIRDGENIEGFMFNESIQGGREQLESFRIKGNKISFTSSTKMPQSKIKIKYKGKIEGDKIRLAYKFGVGACTDGIAIGPFGGLVEVPCPKPGDPGGSAAAQKVSRGGMNDIGKGIDKSRYSEAFTIIRVQ